MKSNILTKSIKIIFFLVLPLLVQFFLSSIYTYTAVKDYNIFIDSVNRDKLVNPLLPLNSAFTYWIGGFGNDTFKNIFYYIIFFCAIIPCLYYILSSKSETINSKFSYCKCFCYSGSFAFISLLFNFISILLFIPAITPDSVYDIYYDVKKGDFLSDLFYANPFVYEMIYMLMICVLCGLIGCFGYGCYRVFNNHVIAFFIPELILLIVHILDLKKVFLVNLSPIIYCNVAVVAIRNLKLYLIELGIILFFTIVIIIINKKKSKVDDRG